MTHRSSRLEGIGGVARLASLALAVGVLVAVLLPALSQATPSVRNGAIAFSARVHAISQVFTVSPDGTGSRQVTRGSAPAGQFGLSWSPDGRSLLYTVTTGGKDRIVRSRPDGTGATVVSAACTGKCLGDDDAVYSPDGKEIAFERAFGPIVHGNASLVAIFTMNADGSHLAQLTQKKATRTTIEDHGPQWSPDGTKVTFVRATSSISAVEVMNADGSNLHRLTPLTTDAANAHWSPSGKRILFNTYADAVPGKSANLFTMRPDGTHRVALTHYAGGTVQAFPDAWSPDGTQILFRRMKYTGTDTEIGDFYILDLRNKQIRRLTHAHISYDAEAAWGK